MKLSEVWQNVKKLLTYIGAVILAILGFRAIWERIRSETDNNGIDTNQREIRKSIDRQGKSIDSGIGRVDRAKAIIGDDADRKRESDELLAESRNIRDRAKKFLDRIEK